MEAAHVVDSALPSLGPQDDDDTATSVYIRNNCTAGASNCPSALSPTEPTAEPSLAFRTTRLLHFGPDVIIGSLQRRLHLGFIRRVQVNVG
jgi:hypothetical protein